MTRRFTLDDLERIIATRASASPNDSWTAKLLARGPARVAKKLGEEAVETVIAGVENDRSALIGESADLLYHLLVLLRARGVLVQDVLDELERRSAQSGLSEKAARDDA
ncbi:MAG: phosphoribosyl-ATP diphosphatase [Hyphomicrobiales bacterium]|nr:phosphoribosyl-ATP diphosphatase [Hyphomicrobiales bacterium]MBV8769610.1 phosphoribosyl-ATP diphosphatase [Hyphomicrobiales bacterium]MBV9053601.1 phosphoribosyl-ATP diphosphatase [Hyphomicrobiales bacterium]MBV9138470.1 phosphoribosyl-ATP diphosphatase [Hyphomicrobiales bacterium]MBV9590372.1 phosphoribosyl-ATP diphosphatase [Hyphomicrobiales bacterium]